MTEFDKIIADKLSYDGYQVDEGMWNAIASSLGSAPAGSVSATPSFAPALISGIAATALMVGIITQMPSTDPIHQDTSTVSIERADRTTVAINKVADPKVEDKSTNTHHPQQFHEIELKEAVSNTVRTEELTDQTIESAQRSTAALESPSSTPVDDQAENNPNLPTIAFRANGIQCVGGHVTFEAEGADDLSYEWIIDGYHVLEGKKVSFSFEEDGEHEVVLMADTKDGSINTARMIQIYDRPYSRVSQDVLNNTQCFNQEVQLTAEPGSNTYQWKSGDQLVTGSNASMMLPKGAHDIVLTTVNEQGCTDEQHLLVSIQNGLEIYIPNSFSPNNDGKNETWPAVGLEQCASHSVQIFRAQDNALVFETTQGEAWDGSIQGSMDKPQRGESFIYRIVVEDECGIEKELKGRITVIP